MEYGIVRAMEINRLTPEQLIGLQAAERNRGRAFMPFEIQNVFGLPELKETYQFPEVETTHGAHIKGVREEFKKKGIYPTWSFLDPLNVGEVHEFDEKIARVPIDYVYSGGRGRKRLRDEVSNENWQD